MVASCNQPQLVLRHGQQCRDAKLSVLDWHDNVHTIHTSSLHYFEGDPSLRMGRTVFPLGPKAVTDPQVLCPSSSNSTSGHVCFGPKHLLDLHCMSCIDHGVIMAFTTKHILLVRWTELC